MTVRLGVRWTIGDVSRRGFDALRLSIEGARRLFGDEAEYAVCFNSLSRTALLSRLGDVPRSIRLVDQARLASIGDTGARAAAISGRLDRDMAEGVAWKLIPLRVFPDIHELALDNDCVLWDVPGEMSAWLRASDRCLLGADVRRCYGLFDDLCGPLALNTGIRGLPPAFDLGAALERVLDQRAGILSSELDEQGLQVAALVATGKLGAVELQDVTICSPFPPHIPGLGRCGAHFVGLNSRSYGWRYFDRPAEQVRAEHWDGLVAEVEGRVRAATSRCESGARTSS
jgi:hypothetical protein